MMQISSKIILQEFKDTNYIPTQLKENNQGTQNTIKIDMIHQ